MSRHHDLSADPVLRLAQRRARAKMGFFIHLAVFVMVNAVLVLIDLLALRRHGFSLFPALGWGLGLAIHGAVVFFAGSGSALHQRLVDVELARLTTPRS